MKARILLPIFVISLVWTGCEKNMITERETLEIDNRNLIGNWTGPEYTDTLVTYNKVELLPGDDYGFSFETENKFLEHKNAGWCGTPPISYGDYEGTWTRNDSILDISVGYWGGTIDYKWKIMDLDQDHLTVHTISVEYHPDENYRN